jgi:hypothetical protein
MGNRIFSLFRDILAVCYTEGVIGEHMFAVDGCKISGNCAKEWSGTREELQRKAEKIRDWLEEIEESTEAQGKPVKSNITDNESAKMPGSLRVIRGDNGIAAVDDKCQAVVDAQAVGEVHEARSLEKVVEAVEETFADIEGKRKIFQEVVLTADSEFNSEQAMRKLLDRGIEAYVADRYFRQRDPRFERQKEYKKNTIDRKRTSKAPGCDADADRYIAQRVRNA